MTAPGSGAPAHPGPARVRLPAAIARAFLDQARAERPNEACGLVTAAASPVRGGVALRYVACRNAAASPVRYAVDPDELFRVTDALDRADEVIWGIAHSHLRTAAIPSPTDVAEAAYPDALYLVASLADEPPDLRAWRIVGGAVHEVELVLA